MGDVQGDVVGYAADQFVYGWHLLGMALDPSGLSLVLSQAKARVGG